MDEAEKRRVRDDGVPVVYVDYITEAWQADGVIAVSFGSIIDQSEIRMGARIRFGKRTAKQLIDELTKLIAAQ
ncbi:MAG: hypothetical protein ABWZ57_18195 [Mesorhizobium sp.]